jgi:hypothetical protein
VQPSQNGGRETLQGNAQTHVDLCKRDRAPDRARERAEKSRRGKRRQPEDARIDADEARTQWICCSRPQREAENRAAEKETDRQSDDDQRADEPYFLRQDTDAENVEWHLASK